MAYREFRPRAELSEFVACTWERTVPSNGESPPARILPDGCVDLIWAGGSLFIAGPDRRPFLSSNPAGATIVGVRLRPGVAGPALGMPASELRDARVGLEQVWGTRGAELSERIATVDDPRGRRRALEDTVLAQASNGGAPDPLVLAATRRLGLPGSRVGSLSDALGTSERQLLRRFDSAVGYGPKTLDRVLRFQRFLTRADRAARGEEGLARIAAEVGYSDQAHLSRECVRLSGLTPTRLVADRLARGASSPSLP